VAPVFADEIGVKSMIAISSLALSNFEMCSPGHSFFSPLLFPLFRQGARTIYNEASQPKNNVNGSNAHK
jgi:hypothetical protein